MPVTEAAFEQVLPIPDAFRNRDIFVEVSAGGIVRSTLVFANDLNVQVLENYGRIKVAAAEGGTILRKVYVKVYGMTRSGEAVFYKDGYTDIRGVFDYASLSSNLIDRVTEYAVLILSDDHGSKIIRVGVPKR